MKQYNLGPNGGILTSCNLFATRFDQVQKYSDFASASPAVWFLLLSVLCHLPFMLRTRLCAAVTFLCWLAEQQSFACLVPLHALCLPIWGVRQAKTQAWICLCRSEHRISGHASVGKEAGSPAAACHSGHPWADRDLHMERIRPDRDRAPGILLPHGCCVGAQLLASSGKTVGMDYLFPSPPSSLLVIVVPGQLTAVLQDICSLTARVALRIPT
eukprot:1161355-Pelagomonas_calceolata.AAC.6